MSAVANADFIRGPLYAFLQSRTALEDVLGLTAALTVSRVSLLTTQSAPGSAAAASSSSSIQTGLAQVQYTRAGPGKIWALLFAIPSLFNVVVLLRLSWRARGGSLRTTGSLIGFEHYVLARQV